MENSRMNKNILCALCGEAINGAPGRKLYHPPAVTKWLEEILDEDEAVELERMVYNRENTIFVHEDCKKSMADNETEIDELNLPWFTKEKLKEVHTKMLPYLEMYHNLRTQICERQNNQCYKCGCNISEKNSVIRRINTKNPREEKNACLVCHSCDEQYLDFIDVKQGKADAETAVDVAAGTVAVPAEKTAEEVSPAKAAPGSELSFARMLEASFQTQTDKNTDVPERKTEKPQPVPVKPEEEFQWNIISEQQKALFRNLSSYEEKLRRQHEEAELEICDIQHYMELSELDVEAGYKAYRMLKERLVRRRHIENELEKVKTFISGTAASFSDGSIDRRIQEVDTSGYKPHILEELFRGQD